MTDMDQHTDAMLDAFVRVVQAEERQRQIQAAMVQTAAEARTGIAQAEREQADGWATIAALMAETGEVEVTLPGAANDFVIGWSTPRESVDVPDAAAVPDEFVQIERKAKKREIGAHLKALEDAGQAQPNWATLKMGEPKLGYRLAKRGAT